MSKTIILIDLSAIYWAAWHASAHEELSSAFQRTVDKVHSLRSGHDFAAVCVDSPPYWRKGLLPTYKAQRDAPEPQALEQLRKVKERLTADGVLLWSAQGFEADDVIATAVGLAMDHGLDVVIASSDKDLMQLVDDESGVRVQSLRDGTMFDSAAVEAKFGVPPWKMLDYLSLIGDASDNVPGVEKVGPKTAAQLLADFGSLDGVFANVDKVRQPKLQENLFRGGPAARLARQIIELRMDVPINFEDIYKPREVRPLVQDHDMSDGESVDEEADSEFESGPSAAPAPTPPPPKDALAVPPQEESGLVPSGWSMALQPPSLRETFKLAKELCNSRLYSKFSSPAAIFAVILRGREMGLPALTALDAFHVIEGKPSPAAHFLIERCKSHPDCEYFYFVGGDDTFAEYETKNRNNPGPTRLRYTIAQAERAGLVKPNSNWTKRPAEMLRKTCAVQLGRIEYPGATSGLYAAEEEFAA